MTTVHLFDRTSTMDLGSKSATAPAAAEIFRPGEVLNEIYEIRSVIGSGGMGQVYEAQDLVLNRRVAIKAAWPHIGAAPLRREAQALAAIRHACMVTVHSTGHHRGVDYLVMERIYGVSLEAHLAHRRQSGEPFTIREVIDVLVALAEGLTAVHRAGVAHRDVKPANTMLAPGNRVVLLDFGVFHPEMSAKGRAAIVGSPNYMAPEAITNSVEPGGWHLVDIYAVGIIAFEMITGSVPYSADSVVDVWSQHLHSSVPDIAARRDDAPERLCALVTALLAKQPNERPQDMESVLWELRAIRDSVQPAPRTLPFSVLIVDDDPESVRILRFWAEKAVPTAEVRTAHDAEAALVSVRKEPPDVMLLDLQMPGMSGLELCLYLRGTHLADQCTIVSVSAGAGEHDVQLLNELGITNFIRKGPELGEKLTPTLQALQRAR